MKNELKLTPEQENRLALWHYRNLPKREKWTLWLRYTGQLAKILQKAG